jgi:micrococcal nuclease
LSTEIQSTYLSKTKKERVRLIGLNTPEVVDPNRPAQCFGKEASDHAHKLLDNQQVALVTDPVAGDRDKFGRLLRYVYRTDGLFIQEDMILRGFGFEYTYRNQKYARRSDLQSAQNIAKRSAEGLWSPNTCAGQIRKAN